MSAQRHRFVGEIAGVGTASGTRIVIGRWADSPFGAFVDVMIERGDGHRLLLAPSIDIAGYVGATYVFDEVRVGPVTLDETADGWDVHHADLSVSVTIGRRTPLGWLLRAVPRRLAISTGWASLLDPIVRRMLRGVRTRGSAAGGRVEWYGATDVRRISAVHGRLFDGPLGALRDVDPPCRFGFSSTPRRPSVTSVVTTIELRAGATEGGGDDDRDEVVGTGTMDP